MPIAAEAVPGLLHVSLFLFFAGLADSTLNINTTIGVSTTVPIGICGLLYIFTTLAPVIYPQSPYQTSFSGVIWYAVQKLRGRRFKDRDGDLKIVSTNMAQGQMQLSMEKTKERNGRDKRAILWLLDNLTEDAEIESFVMSAPRSLDVWTELSKGDVVPVIAERAEPSSHLRMIRNVFGLVSCRFKPFTARRSSANALVNQRDNSIFIPSIHESITFREFCWRIGHLFDTCKNRAAFASDELWRMRARACVEVMASLVFKVDVKLDWFGDTLQVLGDIGSAEGMHKLSLAGRDQAFVVHWMCLSIMAIRSALISGWRLNYYANDRRKNFLEKHLSFRRAREKAREIEETVEHHWRTEHEWHLSSKISFATDTMQELNLTIASEKVDEVVMRIAHQLPGVHLDFPDSDPFLRQSFDLFRDPPKLQFICRHQPLNKFFDFLKRIDACQDYSPNSEYEQVVENIIWPKHLLQRSVWSANDFYHGGLGLAVELFLLSLKQLLSTYPSQESYSTLFVSTFRAITSDRRDGVQQSGSILNILLDIVASEQGLLRTFNYPDYITDEIWELLGDILEGHSQSYSSINSAVRQLTDVQREVGGRYGAKAEAVVSRIRSSQ